MIRVFFDIDFTLFVNTGGLYPSEIDLLLNLENLSEYTGPRGKGYGPKLYAMYRENTKNLLLCLHENPNVEIGFITSSLYPRDVLELLERMYDLPEGIFEDCIYVNRYSWSDSAVEYPKGILLKFLTNNDYIKEEDSVLLVDDKATHVSSAIDYGFDAILATGCKIATANGCRPITSISAHDGYLELILEYVRDKVKENLQSSAATKLLKLKFS